MRLGQLAKPVATRTFGSHEALIHLFSAASPRRLRGPSEGLEGFWEEFEAAYQAGGFFMLIVHPFLTGRLARWAKVEAWLERTLNERDVWFAPLEVIVAHLAAARASGAWSPRVEDTPYYSGPQR